MENIKYFLLKNLKLDISALLEVSCSCSEVRQEKTDEMCLSIVHLTIA